MRNVCNAKETLRKINEESEGHLYITCSIFLNYMKKNIYNGNEKKCKITKKKL